MRNKIGIIFMSLGILLMIGAAGLSLRNMNENKEAEEKSEQVVQQLIMEIEETAQAEPVVGDFRQKEMDNIQIDGKEYVGYLSIASLGINLPIRSEWSYSNLQMSPCRYSGSIHTEDLVIAAHNYKSHFGKIKDIKMGERILFTDIYGKTYEYEAAEAVVLGPKDVEILTNGEFELSLFTCTYDGGSRFVVRCAQVK